MGSILGAIVSGLALGLVEGFTKVIYPEASNIVVFIIMALVLILRPAGLFGKRIASCAVPDCSTPSPPCSRCALQCWGSTRYS